MPTAQQETPDDGQRICPKHVEFYDRKILDKYCIWLVIKKDIHVDIHIRISVVAWTFVVCTFRHKGIPSFQP